jgi:hypothetical protein
MSRLVGVIMGSISQTREERIEGDEVDAIGFA